MWEKHFKKKVRKVPASLLYLKAHSGTVLFLLVKINHLVSPEAEHRLQMGYSKQLMDQKG